MISPRRINDLRPTIILAVLVILCLTSLASGTEAGPIARSVRTAVSVAATPFWRAMTGTSSAFNYVADFFIGYGALQKEADQLRVALAQKTPDTVRLRELEDENRRLRKMLDFQRSDLTLSTIPTAVRVNGWYEGILLVDRGSNHGVRESMCAIDAQGAVVGIVTKVQPFHSVVYTLQHPDCRIGAITQRNRTSGIVQGSGNDLSNLCTMQFIESDDEVQVGDRVVTTGGSVYPRGYLIGTIAAKPRGEDSLLKTAPVEPAALPYRLEEVFLVRSAQIPTEDLAGWDGERAEPPPEPESGGHEMPDRRPIQERLAP